MEINKSNVVVDSDVRLLTVQQVADRYFKGSLSYLSILKLCRSGQINCLRIGRRYYFTEQNVLDWIKINTSSPAYAKVRA